MDEASLLTNLISQGPIVAILGYLTYWFKTRLEKREEELSKFSNEVIKLVAIYQAKFDEDHKKIDEMSEDLKDLHKQVTHLQDMIRRLEK